MKWFLIASGLLVALCGCDPTQQEIEHMRAVLPPGCQIADLGSYGSVDHVVAVFCDGRKTTTQSYREQHGKTHSNEVVVEWNYQ